MSKTRFLRCVLTGVLAIAGFVLVPGETARLLAAQQLTVVSWGGIYSDAQRKAFYQPFERETGVKIVEMTGPSPAKIKAMVQTGNVEWDVAVLGSAPQVEVLARQGLLEAIDYSKFDAATRASIKPEFMHPYAVAGDTFSVVLAYNVKKFPKGSHPRTWADFWDVKKYPGPRAMFNAQFPVPMAEIALLADGVPPDRLYPIDMERVFQSLSKIRPSVVKWTHASGPMQQLLADGEAVMAPLASGRVEKLRQAGVADNDWAQPILEGTWWIVPKGSKNRENAMKFIAFASKARPQAEMAKASSYGPVNREAFELLDAAIKKELPTAPDHMRNTVILNGKWWSEVDGSGKTNIERYAERFEAWMTQ